MLRKRLLILFVCLILIFSFPVACTSSSEESLKQESKTEQVEPKTEESFESKQAEPEEEPEVTTPSENVKPLPEAEEPPQ